MVGNKQDRSHIRILSSFLTTAYTDLVRLKYDYLHAGILLALDKWGSRSRPCSRFSVHRTQWLATTLQTTHSSIHDVWPGDLLTHWGRVTHICVTHSGRVTHICVGKLIIIGSDNGLSPGRRQAIIWTNAGMWSIGPLRTNFSEISIEINIFSFKKTRLKMLSAKWRLFCLGLNELKATTQYLQGLILGIGH